MTRFIELGSIESIIQGAAIERSLVFQKPIASVTATELAVLNKQCEMGEGLKSGKQLMKDVIAEIGKARLLGLIPDCEACRFRLPLPKLSVGELRRILIKFDHMERRLIVFALASGMPLTDAVFFQQNQIKKDFNINKWTHELRRFVYATPTHLHCPYVFWDFDASGTANALIGFDQKFVSITKASWSVFASLCDNLIPMDTEEDAREFATMFVLEAAGI